MPGGSAGDRRIVRYLPQLFRPLFVAVQSSKNRIVVLALCRKGTHHRRRILAVRGLASGRAPSRRRVLVAHAFGFEGRAVGIGPQAILSIFRPTTLLAHSCAQRRSIFPGTPDAASTAGRYAALKLAMAFLDGTRFALVVQSFKDRFRRAKRRDTSNGIIVPNACFRSLKRSTTSGAPWVVFVLSGGSFLG